MIYLRHLIIANQLFCHCQFLEVLAVQNLLSLLTEGDRQVLELAFIDDLNGKDLAANLVVSEGAAYTKKSRAIARLRKAYTQANPDYQEGR